MTKRIKIYLDTSAINFLYADDTPEKQEMTIDFFDNFIKTGVYDTFISGFVIDEIDRTKNVKKKEKLLKVIEDYLIEFVEIQNSKEIQELAKKYVDAGIIPYKNFYDAYHISCSVVNQIDYLVSWNYQHLANVNKERKVIALNMANNYLNNFRIITPLQLIYYES